MGIIAWIVFGFVVAPAHESLFRGYVQSRLCERWGRWRGIIATAALSSVLPYTVWQHPWTIEMPERVARVFLLAVYCGWVAQRSGSARPAIGVVACNSAFWAVYRWAGLRFPESPVVSAACLVLSLVAFSGLVAGVARSRSCRTSEELPATNRGLASRGQVTRCP